MAAYSIAEAKNQFPSLIRKVLEGEEVIITRRGKPVAEVRPRIEAGPSWTPEQVRQANEQMKARRDARSQVSMNSVALLNLMYAREED